MKIGFVIFNGMQLLDLAGPLDIANFWQKLDSNIEVFLVGEKKASINCGKNFLLIPDFDFATAPQFDYLCIPGGSGRKVEMHNQIFLDFVKKQHQACKLITSVCTGAFILAAAGILENHEATTYWRALNELAQYANVKVKEQRIVKSGKVWTCGGVSSGIDLMLEIINEVSGKNVAGKIQLLAEYFPIDKTYAIKSDIKDLPAYYEKDTHNMESYKMPKYINM